MYKPNLLQTHRNAQASEKGQNLVEFSLVAVLLLTLLAGVVDVGRIFFTMIALREAAEEGAAYGSMCPVNENVTVRVRNSSQWPVNMNDPNVVITVSTNGMMGEDVAVSVEYQNYPLIMPFIGTILGGQSITLNSGFVIATAVSSLCP